MNITSILVILLASVFHGLFFSLVLLFIKKGHKNVNLLLALLIASFALTILSSVLFISRAYFQYPVLLGILPQSMFLIGPFLYLYVSALTYKEFEFKQRYLLHFAPYIMAYIFYIPSFLLLAGVKLDEPFSGLRAFPQIQTVLQYLHLFCYIVLTGRLLTRHDSLIKHQYSNMNNLRLGWIYNLLFVFTSVAFIHLFFHLFKLNNPVIIHPAEKYFHLGEAMLIFYISFKGYTQPDVFILDLSAKYKGTGLDTDRAREIEELLVRYMESEKPYLDNNLSLSKLAQRVKTSQHHLSQVINERFQRNFFDFVNGYRIEEAKMQLSFSDNTVLSVAYSCGFNSKSTFNTAFRKHTGQTPSAYRKSVLSNS